MIDLAEQSAAAIYNALNVSNVTDLATGGVWRGEASPSKDLDSPTLIIDIPSSLPSYAFGFTRVMEETLVDLKVFAGKNSSQSAIARGRAVLMAALDEIGQSVTLSEGTCLGVMRDSDLPAIKQPVSNRNIWMTGVRLRIWSNEDASTVETFYLLYNGDRLTYNGDYVTYNP